MRRLNLREKHLVLIPQINPQVELASLDRVPEGNQAVPSFVTADGPVRVPRFIRTWTVRWTAMYTTSIPSSPDVPGCVAPQPFLAKEIANHNVVFRIPTPAFGGGLIEAVSDDELVGNLRLTAKPRQASGIGGRFNHSVNDGTISKFGWKAQNKSLLLFAAESYNVEEGVTNEIFPDERDHTAGCLFNPAPEDTTKLQLPPGAIYPPSGFASDVVNFAAFLRLLAPPQQVPFSTSAEGGSALFNAIGCGLCHSPTLTTGSSPITGMSHIEIHANWEAALGVFLIFLGFNGFTSLRITRLEEAIKRMQAQRDKRT